MRGVKNLDWICVVSIPAEVVELTAIPETGVSIGTNVVILRVKTGSFLWGRGCRNQRLCGVTPSEAPKKMPGSCEIK